MTRLQRDLQGHVILCGYGDSGSIAATELRQRGWDSDRIVVIDANQNAVQRAADRGCIGLHGNAASEALLKVAGVDRAHSVIVSVGRDDTTVLVVLTIREITKRVRVIACVSEQENSKLVRAGGADVLVSPASFGGFLMADAVEHQGTVDFISELLSIRGAYQLQEREPQPAEIGRRALEIPGALVVEIRRGSERLGCWQHKDLRIEPGDRLYVIDSNDVTDATA